MENVLQASGVATSASSAGDTDDLLDIRIALVLYGGVSLAIYENGVARCFYDLVKRRGVFAILLELLGAKAQVDVIAGTSAGGINGMLLAATLESGADFADCAQLWRRLGDFGALLRDPKEADSAPSLLRGETYYQDQLIKAFQTYCESPAKGLGDYPNEMDVFITGTDLDGAKRVNWDALGNEISDKEHRVVFHLEHRPGRKWLGYGNRNSRPAPEEQGAILGTMARITSSFPAAFPPFRLEHLKDVPPEGQKAVQRALERTARSGIEQIADRSFVDGGLLDNKPFGPVLEAIFHRMPTSVVDRRLFYVEPDPEPRPAPPKPSRHKPLSVATASLQTIPSHESIWGDLQQLERHNSQVEWLSRIKKRAVERAMESTDAELIMSGSATYWQVRSDNLARSLFHDSEVAAPSAEDRVANPVYRKLAEMISDTLLDWTQPGPGDESDPNSKRPLLNAFDIDFHLRRSFHLLYGLFGVLQKPPAGATVECLDRCRSAMRLTGRIIKTQKLIRDFLLVLRERVLREPSLPLPCGATDPADLAPAAFFIVNLFRLFLRADAPHWEKLLSDCAVSSDRLRGFDSDWRTFFESKDLTAVADSAAGVVREPTLALTRQLQATDPIGALTQGDLSVRWTILDEIQRATSAVIEAHCRHDEILCDLAVAFDRFMLIDEVLYPIEFAGAVYELDNIEYVRISPQDARTGLAGRKKPRDKVAGDELAHFSAFLRQDWRSNDILQGRLDGICQIIESLLQPTEQTIRWLASRCKVEPEIAERMFAHRIECEEDSRSELKTAWRDLADLLRDEVVVGDGYKPSARLVDALSRFRTCLIEVGQESAFLEDFPSVLEDHFYQEMAFANEADSQMKDSDSHTVRQSHAKKRSLETLEQVGGVRSTDNTSVNFDKWWQLYDDMNLGGQVITGRAGAVPPHTIGEYATQVYLLLYGMIRSSVGETGQAVLDRSSVRTVLRHPLAFLHAIFTLMRRAYIAALGSIATMAGVLLGVVVAAYLLGSLSALIAGVALLLLFMSIVAWAVPRIKRRQLLTALVPAILVVVIPPPAIIWYYRQDIQNWIAGFLDGLNASFALVIGLGAGMALSGILLLVGKVRSKLRSKRNEARVRAR